MTLQLSGQGKKRDREDAIFEPVKCLVPPIFPSTFYFLPFACRKLGALSRRLHKCANEFLYDDKDEALFSEQVLYQQLHLKGVLRRDKLKDKQFVLKSM